MKSKKEKKLDGLFIQRNKVGWIKPSAIHGSLLLHCLSTTQTQNLNFFKVQSKG